MYCHSNIKKLDIQIDIVKVFQESVSELFRMHSYWSTCDTYTKRLHPPPPSSPPSSSPFVPLPSPTPHLRHTLFSPELWTLLPTCTLLPPTQPSHTVSHLSPSPPRSHFHWECSSVQRVSGCPASRPSPSSVGWWQSTWGSSKPQKQVRLPYTLGTGEGEERRRKRKVKRERRERRREAREKRRDRRERKEKEEEGEGEEEKEGEEERGERRGRRERIREGRKGERGEMGGSLCCNAGLVWRVCAPGKLQNFVQTERDGRTNL